MKLYEGTLVRKQFATIYFEAENDEEAVDYLSDYGEEYINDGNFFLEHGSWEIEKVSESKE